MTGEPRHITQEALEEWRRDWKVPLVAMIGSGASITHFSTLGIFIKPIMADTGWSLSAITACSLIFAIVGLVTTPLVGRLLDRAGAGKVATVGLILFLLAFAALGMAHSPLQWLLLWVVLAVAGMFTRGPVWAMPVAKRFDKSRGFALALMGCGLGFYGVFMPSLTQAVVTAIGWRMAYPAIAGIIFLFSWPLVFTVFGRRTFDAESNSRAATRTDVGQLAGPTWREALRSRYLWQMTAAAIMVGAGVLGMQVHLAPMLQEKSMAPAIVAAVMGALGVSALVGRFLTGYLLDRYSGRLIGAMAFLLPVLACLIYLRFDGSVGAALAIVVIFGFSGGAESDVVAFLTARYLGLRSFGVCFSVIFALQAIGAGAGPLITSKLHEFYGDYDGATRLLIAFLVAGALLFITLGAPPNYEKPGADDPEEAKARDLPAEPTRQGRRNGARKPRVAGARLLVLCAVVYAAGGLFSSSKAQDGRAVGAASDWPATGGAADESGYSRLRKITAANVGRMGLAWSLDLPGEVALEATPLAVGGVLYFTGDHSAVYAVDAATGRLRWKYDPQVWKVTPEALRQYAANRGVAYEDGRIFVGVLDGRLVALDARSGKVLWSVMTVVPGRQVVRGAPRTFWGKVIIGANGGDVGYRCYVTAYDTRTGKQVWRFYTVPGSPRENRGDPAMEHAAGTWPGEFWKTGTGGAVWGGMTFDPELDRIYLATANSGPYNPSERGPDNGDHLYIASVVALDADTGKYVWHYQENPGEEWDYDADANMPIATLMIGGQPRKVLMHAPKNGFFYVLDRTSGKLISAEKIGKVTWADHIDLATGRPVEAANIHYETGEVIIWPSMIGAHNWQPMSFNPRTGLVYIPYMQAGARYSSRPKPGEFTFGGVASAPYKADADDGTGQLLAWDPVRQSARWRAPRPYMWNGGTLTTAGGLVFQGTADGRVVAHDAARGDELWRFDAGLGVIAAPTTYTVGGRQYVSVLSGYGGATAAASELKDAGWKYGAQPRRLLTFSLGGKAKLPPSSPPDKVLHPVDDPSIKLDAAIVLKGRELSMRCAACHGRDLKSPGSTAPDLRESQLALSEPAFAAVVHDGARMRNGMPRFEYLTPDHVHALWSYVRAAAREASGTQSPKP